MSVNPTEEDKELTSWALEGPSAVLVLGLVSRAAILIDVEVMCLSRQCNVSQLCAEDGRGDADLVEGKALMKVLVENKNM